MNTFIEGARLLYYKEYDNTELIHQLNNTLNTSIITIDPMFTMLFDRLLNKSPSKYWDRKTTQQVFDKLEACFSRSSTVFKIEEDAFEFFLMGYSAYEQISETWTDVHEFNITPETKTRLYRIPMYTSIAEGCLSNLLRFLSFPLSVSTGKDYTIQSKLGPLLDIMKTNGLNEIVNHVDVNIRNAINHGKVSLRREGGFEKIHLYYTEGHQSRILEMPLHDFDQRIDEAYDMVSGVIMGVALFLNAHIQVLQIDKNKQGFIPFSLFAMELSTPINHCYMISDVQNNEQINVDMQISNCDDKDHILQLAITIAIIVYDRYRDYKKYYISLSHPRMLTNWMRFTQNQIIGIINGTMTPKDVVQQVLSKDALMFPPSEEKVDPSDYKYFCFPNYTKEGMSINRIADASLQDRKRLKAHMYIGDTTSREEIIAKIETGIEWLKTVKNPPSPQCQLKHGDMPADAIYLNVYKYDERKNKELLISNDNFVCFVDYNYTGSTTLKNGGLPLGVWKQFCHETVGLLQIAWRDKKNQIRHVVKVGRNDPCPCGSGKKYKHCCGR